MVWGDYWRHGWKPSATIISHCKTSKYWKLEFTTTGLSKVTLSWQPRLSSVGSKCSKLVSSLSRHTKYLFAK